MFLFVSAVLSTREGQAGRSTPPMEGLVREDGPPPTTVGIYFVINPYDNTLGYMGSKGPIILERKRNRLEWIQFS